MDKRIVIKEEDVTSNGSVLSSRDIVYVPGFSYYAEGSALATAKVGQPVLCTTISDFKEAFGDRPAVFKDPQPYPRYDAAALTAGFDQIAIPDPEDPQAGETTIWFKANDVDPSYVYAYQLIAKGIPVVYERMNTKGCKDTTGTDVTVKDFYEKVWEAFSYLDNLTAERTLLTDPSLPIKYFTTGGYPAFEYYRPNGTSHDMLTTVIATLAMTRGDAFALLDHTNNPSRKLYGDGSVFTKAQTEFASLATAQTYVTMFTPWANYTVLTNFESEGNPFSGDFPGSYAYLTCLASVIQTNPAWTAIAGVSRGLVPQLNALCLDEKRKLTNAIANAYQPDPDEGDPNYYCINAITNIKGYGYCLWGDRTLRNQHDTKGYALNFLHIRNLICDIKKLAYDTSTSLMFEPNSNTLWGNFKGSLTPTLDKMKATQGISDYAIIKLASEKKTKLVAKINIYPMYAVEKFEIFINITDEEVSVG